MVTETRRTRFEGAVLGVVSVLSNQRFLGPFVVVAGAGAACAAVWFGDPTTPGGPLPTCPTKMLLGITCPGCGTMRAVYSLLHADLGAALHYNALAVVAFLLLGWAFLAYVVRLWSGKRIPSWQSVRYMPWVVLTVVVVWFVIRNIPIEPFSALRV